MDIGGDSIDRKPNWQILKEAARELIRSGKTVFTRKELTSYARKLDPARSEASLDFEIDLVTVNSNSKDKYRDPDKLFLYRVDRGRYTLYNPEIHGSIDNYLLQRIIPIRRDFLEQIINKLEEEGFHAREYRGNPRSLSPNIVAERNGERIGVWVIDPSLDPVNQTRLLAYSIGAILLNRNYTRYLLIIPYNLANKLSSEIRKLLESIGVRIAYLREERRYNIVF